MRRRPCWHRGIDPNEAKQEEKRVREAVKGEIFKKMGHTFLAKQRKEGKSKATLDKTEYHLKLTNQGFGTSQSQKSLRR